MAPPKQIHEWSIEFTSLAPNDYVPISKNEVTGKIKRSNMGIDPSPPTNGTGALTPVYVTEANTADITAEDGKIYICSNTSVVKIFPPATATYTTTLRFAVASVTNGQNFSIRKATDAALYLFAEQVSTTDRGISNLAGVNGYSYIELLKVSAAAWYAIAPINVIVQIDQGDGGGN